MKKLFLLIAASFIAASSSAQSQMHAVRFRPVPLGQTIVNQKKQPVKIPDTIFRHRFLESIRSGKTAIVTPYFQLVDTSVLKLSRKKASQQMLPSERSVKLQPGRKPGKNTELKTDSVNVLPQTKTRWQKNTEK